jgi:hypothetical protein
MPTIDELVSRLPLDQIAKQLGVDEATAAAATKEASEALVRGIAGERPGPSKRRVAGQGNR